MQMHKAYQNSMEAERKKKIMIFASDLDRTLVFSKRFLNELGDTLHHSDGVIVEKTDSGYGMMYASMLTFLEMIRPQVYFIPCTSRNIEQFKRISLGMQVPYAVVENGCKVLRPNGMPSVEYAEHIKYDLGVDLSKETPIIYEKVIEATALLGEVIDVRQVSNSFVLVQPEVRVESILNKIIKALEELGGEYNVCVDKWKIYITHKKINKATALKWVAKKLGEEIVVAAGDTTMDEPLLNAAKYAIIPKHSTLRRENIKSDIIEVSSGMNGTHEMIGEIIKCYRYN